MSQRAARPTPYWSRPVSEPGTRTAIVSARDRSPKTSAVRPPRARRRRGSDGPGPPWRARPALPPVLVVRRPSLGGPDVGPVAASLGRAPSVPTDRAARGRGGRGGRDRRRPGRARQRHGHRGGDEGGEQGAAHPPDARPAATRPVAPVPRFRTRSAMAHFPRRAPCPASGCAAPSFVRGPCGCLPCGRDAMGDLPYRGVLPVPKLWIRPCRPRRAGVATWRVAP